MNNSKLKRKLGAENGVGIKNFTRLDSEIKATRIIKVLRNKFDLNI